MYPEPSPPADLNNIHRYSDKPHPRQHRLPFKNLKLSMEGLNVVFMHGYEILKLSRRYCVGI